MGAPLDQAPPWQDNGFPPRTFPVEPAGGVTGRRPTVPRRRRGRWLAGLAALIALLVLAAGLLLATRGDDDPSDLAAIDTSTTVPDTSVPTLDSTTSLAPTTTTLEPVGTTVAPDAPTTTAAAAAGAGVLETSVAALALPKPSAGGGLQTARLTLRNSGPSALTYTTESTSPGLSASPSRSTIPAGARTEVTVSLDGSRVATEGPFTGTLTIGGTGGTKAVQVTSTVGRAPTIAADIGEACTAPSVPCSRQIDVGASPAPNPSPCTTPWLYAVTVTDQSQIQSVKAMARKGLANADAALTKAEQPQDRSGAFRSTPMAPVPAGLALRFVIEATDQFGFTTRLAEQTISC